MVLAEEMLTVPEMAARLRISRVRAYSLIEEAGIPYVRLSERRIRIPRDLFESWLADQTVRGERADTVIASQ
jgi:excisionase family DNA binding protein